LLAAPSQHWGVKMSIYKGSRYEYSTIDYVATNNYVEKPIVFYTFSDLGFVNYWEHTFLQGERLDQLADRYYKNSEYWWVIAEFNPAIIDLNNIKPGTILKVPNV
jgi:hypothetical protein